MIYVVEFPHQGTAGAWFAFDADDFSRKVYAGDALAPYQIHDVVTPRELLDMVDKTPDDAGVRDEFPAICGLADQHGWDTPLYRADYLLGEGVLRTEPVSETDACIAALKQRLRNFRIYWEDAAAMAALDEDPIFASRDGMYAHQALREQLIALEVLDGVDG